MAEEIKKEGVEEDYIARLQELKAKSVDLDEYNKVRDDNKRLLDAMLNGAGQTENTKKVEEVDVQGLRNELYGGRFQGTDLDYMTKTLELRKAIMDRGEPDPAVIRGLKVEPTEADYAYCESTCNTIQECIDYAAGDAGVFRSELMRRASRK